MAHAMQFQINTLKDSFKKRLSYLKGSYQGHLNSCARLFLGKYESQDPFLSKISVELFNSYLWVTTWKNLSLQEHAQLREILQQATAEVLPQVKAAVLMNRSEVASQEVSQLFWGDLLPSSLTTYEFGVPYQIKLLKTKHPGLFLDHASLRKYLTTQQNQKSVLNLFSYTASLSLAAVAGGASNTVSIDLSKATTNWAKENFSFYFEHTRSTHDDLKHHDFIYGDVFEWLPKLHQRGLNFDTILCDPPSFSRSSSKKGKTFSTQKDLARLHELIFALLKPHGTLMSSINSENISSKFFKQQIESAAQSTHKKLQWLSTISLPEYEQDLPFLPREPYLKGYYVMSKS